MKKNIYYTPTIEVTCWSPVSAVLASSAGTETGDIHVTPDATIITDPD